MSIFHYWHFQTVPHMCPVWKRLTLVGCRGEPCGNKPPRHAYAVWRAASATHTFCSSVAVPPLGQEEYDSVDELQRRWYVHVASSLDWFVKAVTAATIFIINLPFSFFKCLIHKMSSFVKNCQHSCPEPEGTFQIIKNNKSKIKDGWYKII